MINEIIRNVCNKNENKIFYKNDKEFLTYKELNNKAEILINLIPKDYKGPIIIHGNKDCGVLISIVACLLNNNAYISINDSIPKERIKNIINESHAEYQIDCINKETKIKKIQKYNDNNYTITNNAYIIFTSGTTGRPKGVSITKENLENFVFWINKIIPKENVNNIFNQANFSFDLSVADLYLTLSNGYTLYGFDGNLLNVVEKIKNEKIDLMVVTPTFIKYCLLDNNFNSDNLINLKTIFFCGERLDKKIAIVLKERFKNINIINAYGPTEATCAVSANIISNEELKYDILPVGKIDNAAVKIEIIGNEIILKGKSVFNGYLNFKSENCYKENNVNCYKTGDIGYIKDGYLFCNGRIDNQIKYKGYRIEIEEIESVIENIDKVNNCLVVLNKKDGIVKSIDAYVEANITEKEIKEKLRDVLPNYMIPKNIKIVDKIPFNNNLKKDRCVVNEL